MPQLVRIREDLPPIRVPDGATQEQIVRAVNDSGLLSGGVTQDTGRKIGEAPRGDFSRGVSAGIDSLQGSLYGLAALAGDTAGNDELTQWGLQNYQRNEQEAAAVGPRVGELSKIKDFGDFIDYAQGAVGQAVPSIASTAGTGGVGGFIGKQVAKRAVTRLVENGIKKEAAELAVQRALESPEARKQIMSAIKVGAGTGAFAGSAGQQQGDLYGTLREAGIKDAALPAWGFGAVQGALDIVPEAAIFHKLTAENVEKQLSKSIARGILKGTAQQAAIEGTTEGAQQALTSIARITAGGADWDSQDTKDVLNNMAAGAIVGTVMGAPTEISSRLRAKKNEQAQAPKENQSTPPVQQPQPARAEPVQPAQPAAPAEPAPTSPASAQPVELAPVPGNESNPVTDAPTAEPASDINAQLSDLADPQHPRKGVYLSAENIAANKDTIQLPPGLATVVNADGRGGVMFAKPEDANAFQSRMRRGENREQVLGEFTLSGDGKPATDNPVVVQQKNADGAVTRESVVDQSQAENVRSQFETDGRTAEAVSPQQALDRRQQLLDARAKFAPKVTQQGDLQFDLADDLDEPSNDEHLGKTDASLPYTYVGVGNRTHGEERVLSHRERLEGKSNKYVATPYRGADAKEKVEALAERRQKLDRDATYVARLVDDKEAKENGLAGPGWYVAAYRQPSSEMGFASVAGGPRTLHQITQVFLSRAKERWDRLSLRQKNPQKGDPVYGFRVKVLDSEGNQVRDNKGNPKVINVAASELVSLGRATDETLRGNDAMSTRDAFREGLRNLMLFTDDDGNRYVPESFDAKRPTFSRNLVLRDSYTRDNGVNITGMTLGEAHEFAKTQTRATGRPVTQLGDESQAEAREREVYRGVEEPVAPANAETPAFDNSLIREPVDTRGFESEAEQNDRSVREDTGRAREVYNEQKTAAPADDALRVEEAPPVMVSMHMAQLSKAIDGAVKQLHSILKLKHKLVVSDQIEHLSAALKAAGYESLVDQVEMAAADMGNRWGFVAGTNTGDTKFIYLNPNNSGSIPRVMRTLGHELGHVFFKTHWDNANLTTRGEIYQAFDAFLEKNPNYREDAANYGKRLEEWIADQVSLWIATNKTPRTAVERFFSELASFLQDAWKYISKIYKTDETVQQFITDALTSGDDQVDPALQSLGAANDSLQFDMEQPPAKPSGAVKEALARARAWKAKHPTVNGLMDGAAEAVVAMHDGLTASLQARIRRMNIPSFNKIVEQFHLRAGQTGGFTYNSAVKNRMRNFVADYDKIVRNLADKSGFLEQLRQEKSIDQMPLHFQEKARQFRDLMKRLYAYQREAHMPINEVQNYFPQIADIEAMLAPGAVDEIFNEIQKSGVKWNTSHGDIDITREMVAEWISNYTDDSYAIDFDPSKLEDTGGNMRSPFQQALRTRQLPKNVRDVIAGIKNSDGQAKYYNKNLDSTMHRYIREAVKRSEYNRRFGDVSWDSDETQALGENARPFNAFHQFNDLMTSARKEGATPDQQAIMFDAMAAFMGQYNKIKTEPLRKLSRSVMFYQNLRTLMLVTFSSIPEVATLFIRTGDFGRTWSTIRSSARDAFAKGGMSSKLLRAYGFAVDEYDAWAFNELKEARDYNDTIDRANEAWFRLTGLTRWTNFMRGLSLNVSLDYVKEHARRVAEGRDKDGDSQRRLDELNLTADDVKLWAEAKEPVYGQRGVSEEDLKLGMSDYTAEQIAAAKKLTGAVSRMINEIVVDPTAAMQPLWRSDERLKFIGQLGAFTYGFTNQVLGRIWHELTRDGATNMQRAQVVASLALMIPLVALGLELRELVQYNLFGLPGPTDDMSTPKYMLNLVSRAGVLGVAQLGVDASVTAYSNKSPLLAFLGPTLGQVNDAFTQPAYKTIPGAIPILGQIPGLRDPLRAALK